MIVDLTIKNALIGLSEIDQAITDIQRAVHTIQTESRTIQHVLLNAEIKEAEGND